MRGRRGGPHAAATISSRTGHRSESSDWNDVPHAGNGVADNDEEDESVCPLCIELLDETEQRFRPCPCGYQVCLFCYERIKLELNGLCPSCRTPYGTPQTQSPPPVGQKSRPAAQLDKLSATYPRPSNQPLPATASSPSTAISVSADSAATMLPNAAAVLSSPSFAHSSIPSNPSNALASSTMPSLWSAAGSMSAATRTGNSVSTSLGNGPASATGFRQSAWPKASGGTMASNSTSAFRAPWAPSAPFIASSLPALVSSTSVAGAPGRPAWGSSTPAWNAATATTTVGGTSGHTGFKSLLGSSPGINNSEVIGNRPGPVLPPVSIAPDSCNIDPYAGNGILQESFVSAGTAFGVAPELQKATTGTSGNGISVMKSPWAESKEPGFSSGAQVLTVSATGSRASMSQIGSSGSGSTAAFGQSSPWGSVETAFPPSTGLRAVGHTSRSSGCATSASPALGSCVQTSDSLLPACTGPGAVGARADRTDQEPNEAFEMAGARKPAFSLAQFKLGANGLHRLQQQLQQLSFAEGWSSEEMEKASAMVAAARTAQAQRQGKDVRVKETVNTAANLGLGGTAWSKEPNSSLLSGGAGVSAATTSRQHHNWAGLLEREQADGVRLVDSGAEMSGEMVSERAWQAPSVGTSSASRPLTPGSYPSTPGSATSSHAATPFLSRSSSFGASAAALPPASHTANGLRSTPSGLTSFVPQTSAQPQKSVHLGGTSQGSAWNVSGVRPMSPQPSPPLTPGSTSGSRPGSLPASPRQSLLPPSALAAAMSTARTTPLSASAGVFIPHSQTWILPGSSSAPSTSLLSNSLFVLTSSVPMPASSSFSTSVSSRFSSRSESGRDSKPPVNSSGDLHRGPNLGGALGPGFDIGLTSSIWGPPGMSLAESSSHMLLSSTGEESRGFITTTGGSATNNFQLAVGSDSGTKPGVKTSSASRLSGPASYRPPDLEASLLRSGSGGSRQWNGEFRASGPGPVGNSGPNMPRRAPAPYRPPLGPPTLFGLSDSLFPLERPAHDVGQMHQSARTGAAPGQWRSHGSGLGQLSAGAMLLRSDAGPLSRKESDLWQNGLPTSGGADQMHSAALLCRICRAYRTAWQEDLDEHTELCQHAASIVD